MARKRSGLLFVLLFGLIVAAGTGTMLLRAERAGPVLGGPHEVVRHGQPSGSRPRTVSRPDGSTAVEYVAGPENPPPAVEFPAAVTIRVVDAIGLRPVVHAHVELRDLGSTWTGLTDSAGACRFSGVEAGGVAILVLADGFLDGGGPATLAAGANPEVTYLLDTAALLEGTVVAAADGRPVAGAIVSATMFDRSPRGGMATPSAVSGRDGAWTLRAGIPGRNVSLMARAAGFAPARAGGLLSAKASARARFDFRLEAAGEITGVVRDPDGRPAASAAVTAAPIGGRGATWASGADAFLQGGSGLQVTGADGRYCIDELEAGGLYTVVARKPGFASSAIAEVHLPQGAPSVGVDLALRKCGGIRVRGQDEQGSPVIVSISITGETSGIMRYFPSSPEGFIPDLPPDRYHVTASVPPAGSLRGVVDRELAEGEQADLVVRLVRSPSIVGTVVDSEGRPVNGASVTAILTAPDGQAPVAGRDAVFGGTDAGAYGQPTRVVGGAGSVLLGRISLGGRLEEARSVGAVARTDRQGNFELSGLGDEQAYRVRAEVRGAGTVLTDLVRPSPAALRLVIPAGGRVVFRLLMPGGREPATCASTSCVSRPGLPTLGGAPWSVSRPYEAGRGPFTMDVPAGPGRLTASSGNILQGGMFFLAPVDFDLAPGGRVDLGDLTLVAGATVAGRVTDAAGAPVAGAMVIVAGGMSGTTDEHGEFSFKGVAPGDASVVVRSAEFLEARIVADARPGAAPVVVVLSRGGLMRGTAMDVRGLPFAAARVSVFPVDGSNPAGSAPAATAVVDHRGRFQARLAPGEYRVEIRPRNGPADAGPVAEGTIVLVEGGETALELRASTR